MILSGCGFQEDLMPTRLWSLYGQKARRRIQEQESLLVNLLEMRLTGIKPEDVYA